MAKVIDIIGTPNIFIFKQEAQYSTAPLVYVYRFSELSVRFPEVESLPLF